MKTESIVYVLIVICINLTRLALLHPIPFWINGWMDHQHTPSICCCSSHTFHNLLRCTRSKVCPPRQICLPCTVPTSSLHVRALREENVAECNATSCEWVHQSNCRLYFILQRSDPRLHFPGTFYLSLPLTHSLPAETFEAETTEKKGGRMLFFLHPSFNLTAAPTSVIKHLRRCDAIRKSLHTNLRIRVSLRVWVPPTGDATSATCRETCTSSVAGVSPRLDWLRCGFSVRT